MCQLLPQRWLCVSLNSSRSSGSLVDIEKRSGYAGGAVVIEGEKERIQVYEGTVIARKGSLNTETFTVRKLSYGVGVERIFPVHSPIVSKVDVVRQGRVRRAKLYYLRGKKGRFAKVEEREFVGESKSSTQPTAPAASEEEAVTA